MTKLTDHFTNFLDGVVNLNQSRLDALDQRLETIESFLANHAELGPLMSSDELIPQGSYAQKTIIKPLPAHEFDVDALVPMQEQPDAEPRDYISQLYSAFRSSGTYRSKVSRKTRCVTLQYANDFHIDLVPYIERGGRRYITNRHDNRFELTNPERFTEWLDEQSRVTGEQLIAVIRLMKYLRDFKQTFTARSIILTTLLGGRVNFVNLIGDPGYYTDVPTTLVNIVADLDTYLQANPCTPVLLDPGGTGEDFSHRWDDTQYQNFRARIHRYSALMSEAFNEADAENSERLWQGIFGSNFTAPPIQKRALLLEAASPAPHEQFLDSDFGFPYRPNGYRLRIIGKVGPKPGFRTYDLPKQGNRVLKGRTLTFRIAHCDVPAPYEIYWKVRNGGAEAADRHALRGEITSAGNTKVETTLYRGSHWVECYIVKDGVCVARNRHPVIIR
ncbi:MAG: hypothetical protein QOH12_338 [Solirubrobacteraceae bacterium]|jgi:hypothetical protein|nr:hypothetical protein [Solirubrobacteraceae bacterium]